MENPKPSQKSEGMERMLTNLFGFNRRETILKFECAPTPFGCGRQITAEEFTKEFDSIEQKEYTISGLCNKCQREIFKPMEDEDE